jgi:hypothetical protein
MSMLLTLLLRPTLNRACRSSTHVRLRLSPPNAYLIIARVSVALFLRFEQNLIVTSSDSSRNRIRPDTQLQIRGRKNQRVHRAAWNFVHWLSYAHTVIYHCIALLQLPYRRNTSPGYYGYTLIDFYVIIRKLLHSIFNKLPVFAACFIPPPSCWHPCYSTWNYFFLKIIWFYLLTYFLHFLTLD